MKKRVPIALMATTFVLLIWLTSCQEEYHVTLDNIEPMLVVDGLITDQPGPHKVSISKTVKFQEDYLPQKVYGAIVKITGTDGTLISLEERLSGEYYTPEDFAGAIGESYILHITTADGEKFRSASQEIIAPVSIDSIFGRLGQEVFYLHSFVSNNVYVSTIDGTNTYFQTSQYEGAPKYRFATEMYLQYYIIYDNGMAAETYDYCWTKRNINDQVGPDIGNPNGLPRPTDKVGFVIRNRNDFIHFAIPHELYDMNRVLINKVYTLNNDSFLFHKTKNEQLDDEGRFFDPIASQIQGNIQCISDPSKKVIGLFEASSETIITYKVISDFLTKDVTIEVIDNLEDIPRSGCSYEEFPEHWIY